MDSNERARPRRARRHLERLDPLIVAGILAIFSSFALGYKLDWSKTPRAAAELPAVVEAISPSINKEFSTGIMTPDKWRRMTETLDLMARDYRAPVAIYLQDLKTGAVWAYHPDQTFRAASLIKLPLMAAVFYKIKEGSLSLDQKLVLRRRDRNGGSGTLKWRPDGASFTVQELLIHLISESDNTAANMLLNAAGLNYVQAKFTEMGLVHTCIHEEGMSLRGAGVDNDNYTTAREMNMLLTKIYRGQLVDAESSRQMLDILRYKKPEASRLAVGLPAGWVIAHKTGLERRACHDSAIFFTPYGDYSLTVLTGHNTSYRQAKSFITRLGSLTFAYYGARLLRWQRRYYARALRRRSLGARSAIR